MTVALTGRQPRPILCRARAQDALRAPPAQLRPDAHQGAAAGPMDRGERHTAGWSDYADQEKDRYFLTQIAGITQGAIEYR